MRAAEELSKGNAKGNCRMRSVSCVSTVLISTSFQVFDEQGEHVLIGTWSRLQDGHHAAERNEETRVRRILSPVLNRIF